MNSKLFTTLGCPYCKTATIGAVLADIDIKDRINIMDNMFKDPRMGVLRNVFKESNFQFPTLILKEREVVKRFNSFFIQNRTNAVSIGVLTTSHFKWFIESFLN